MSNPNKPPQKQLPNTLTELANRYGFSRETLVSMVKQYPNLYIELEPFIANNKRIYPPALLDKIVEHLGEP